MLLGDELGLLALSWEIRFLSLCLERTECVEVVMSLPNDTLDFPLVSMVKTSDRAKFLLYYYGGHFLPSAPELLKGRDWVSGQGSNHLGWANIKPRMKCQI